MKRKLLLIMFCLLWPVVALGAPVDFTFTSLAGETYTAAELRGQVVVLNFVAHWCPICQAEAADVERAYQAYKEKDVLFLNAFVMGEVADIKSFVHKYRLTFPFGSGEAMARQFRVKGVPVAFFIDREGVVRQRYPGKIAFDDLQAGIEKLL